MKVISKLSQAVLLSTIVVQSACGSRELVIESTTRWSGVIGNNSYESEGNYSVTLEGSGKICWALQKDTQVGYLRAYVKTSGITGSSVDGFGESTARFGTVTGCSP
jgi:hypothetical protein